MRTFRIYPDTNIALHYRGFEEIDWRTLVGAAKDDQVVVVVTPVLLREIDDQKDRGRGVVQGRARRVSSWLGKVRRDKKTELRPGVRIEVDATEPEVEVDFAAHGLAPTVNDDKIVACLVRDRRKHAEATIVCVTTDNTLAYKVDAKGFTVVDPAEDDRLPDDPDPSEAEKRELQRKLIELEGRVAPRPDLDLRFTNGQAHAELVLTVFEPVADEDIEAYLQEEGERLGYVETVLAMTMRPPSREAISRYIDDLRKWIVWFQADQARRGVTFGVDLMLSNAGHGNAADIDIDLTFPERIFVAETRALPDGPERPTPPRPRDMLGFDEIARIRPFALGQVRPLSAHLASLLDPKPVRLVFDEGRPHEAKIHVRSLKHSSEVSLPRIDAWFASADATDENGFQIAYQIHAASPEVKKDVLHVRLNVERKPVDVWRGVNAKIEPEEESDEP